MKVLAASERDVNIRNRLQLVNLKSLRSAVSAYVAARKQKAAAS
jgi:hypothetical protein